MLAETGCAGCMRLAMNFPSCDFAGAASAAASAVSERLIRVRTSRRGSPVELLVQYEITRFNGCDSFRIQRVNEMNGSTGTN